MERQTIYLGVRASSAADADRLVSELHQYLREHTENISVDRAKVRADTQDAGTFLVALFAAPAIVELAKGVADWMRKRNVTVTVSADGTNQLEGPPEHVERLLELILRKNK